MTPFNNENIVKAEGLAAVHVADALGLCDGTDDYDATGEYIAMDLLSGKIAFTRAEIKKIADYVGLSVDELAEADERFAGYKRYAM